MPVSGRVTKYIVAASLLSYTCGLAAQQAKLQSNVVSGTVITTDDKSVTVHLRASSANPLRYYDGYEQVTDSQRHFRFVGVEPGTYTLEAESETGRSGSSEAMTIQASRGASGISLTLLPKPVLCGHVTEDGKARKSILWFYHYDPESGTLVEKLLPNETQADGYFRITDVPSGTNYLKAYQTWFPNSMSFNGAEPIDSSSTKAACTYDIAYINSGCMAHKVTGQIAHVPEDANRKYHLVFLQTNKVGTVPAVFDFMDKPEHGGGDNFSASVCSGNYQLALTGEQLGNWVNGPSEKIVFDSRSLTVGDTDISGIDLTPHPMATVSGDVTFAGIKREEACPGRGGQRVEILRKETGEYQSAELDRNGKFHFESVSPGTYSLTLSLYSREKVYIQNLSVDGTNFPGREFTIAAAKPIFLQVAMSADPANAAGHVPPAPRDNPRWEVDWTRPKGSVAGRVEGDLQAGSTVLLRAARYNSNSSGEYRTPAEPDGSFKFPSVDPGVYTLRLENKATLPAEYGAKQPNGRGTPLIVNRGAQLNDLVLHAIRLSAICGRVIDSSGNPLSNTRILPERSRDGNVAQDPSGYPPEPDVRTNKEGLFRYEGLFPGDVFLATPFSHPPQLFFSTSGGLSDAEPVHLVAGEDLGCGTGGPLQLKMPANASVRYTVAGSVDGVVPPKEGDRFWVTLIGPRTSGESTYVDSAPVNTDHTFQLQHVPAGQFVLELFSAYGPEPRMWSGPYAPVSHKLASQTLIVSADTNGISVHPQGLASVTGTVVFTPLPDAWKKNFDVSRQMLSLRERDWRRPNGALLKADGSFEASTVDEGDYRVEMNLPEPLYIKAVRLNGKPLQGTYFHVAQADRVQLAVDVSDDAGQVHATVSEEPGLPRPEPSVGEVCNIATYPAYTLYLIPEAWLAARSVKGGIGADTSPILKASGYGAEPITLRLAPPGKYRAIVLQSATRFPSFRSTSETAKMDAWWRELAMRGSAVTVAAGEGVKTAVSDQTVFAAHLAAKLELAEDEDPLTITQVY